MGLENYLAQMIIKTMYPVQEPLCYDKGKVHSLHLHLTYIDLNETYSCPAHNFVVGPAPGMVRYRDLVFHTCVRSHQGAFLLKALGGDISVLWIHFFSSLIYNIMNQKFQFKIFALDNDYFIG